MLLRTIHDFLGIADRAREQPRKGPPADNRHPNCHFSGLLDPIKVNNTAIDIYITV
jgi:hypothetical protein